MLTAAVVATSLVACGGSNGVQPREVPFSRVAAFWATTDLRQTYAIRTEAEWRTAWQAHEPLTTPKTERPAVDFTTSMVLGLTLGSGPNGCHGVAIRRVVEQESRVQVEYSVATPAPGVACTQAIVPLTDFVVVERVDKPVAFLQTDA